MWSMAKDESEDPWVSYAWQYGDVSLFPSNSPSEGKNVREGARLIYG